MLCHENSNATLENTLKFGKILDSHSSEYEDHSLSSQIMYCVAW